MKKVILITGASSGMGKEAAILLAKEGYTVYAGARRAEKLEVLKSEGIIPIVMDVTNDSRNEEVVNTIIAKEGRLDVLINNAGFGLYGPVEDISIEDARYQFDVNIFGLAQLTQLVIPHMRQQGEGRIINISSMGGKIFTPFGAWYHATKHALEGWSDCLRLELDPFNIPVVLIEPGGVKTEFADVLGQHLSKYEAKSAYKEQMAPFINMINDPKAMENSGSEPIELARVFVEAVKAKNPKRRYVKGYMAKPMMFIRKWMGDGAFEWVLKRAFA